MRSSFPKLLDVVAKEGGLGIPRPLWLDLKIRK